MHPRSRWLVVGAAALGVAAAGFLGLAFSSSGGTSGAAGTDELLPDLEQVAPGKLEGSEIRRAGARRFLLGFASAVDNVGLGSLEVIGERSSFSIPRMRVRQVVLRADGTRGSEEVAAVIRYVRSETHQHWHLLDFERYELRTGDGRRLVAPDRKTGFCLGDRYQARTGLENQPRSAVITGECGRNEPQLLEVREGISVGYGDDYKPTLEGQNFDLTGLRAGRYLLVHRANPDRVLRESDYGNNAASLLFRLGWPRGTKQPPRIQVIRRCPDSDRCR